MILQRALISETVTTDHSYYTIRYSEPLNLVEINWNEISSTDELQISLLHLLNVIKEKQPQFLIADTRHVNSFSSDDQSWIRNTFLSALSTSSITRFARITEPDVFTQAIIESLLGYVQEENQFGCLMRSFDNREPALDWLFSTL
jgi:hypothetical protein